MNGRRLRGFGRRWAELKERLSVAMALAQRVQGSKPEKDLRAAGIIKASKCKNTINANNSCFLSPPPLRWPRI